MKTRLRVLHLEDNPPDAELIRARLEDGGFDCELVLVNNRADFEETIARDPFDVILSDFSLPGYDGLSALAKAREKKPDVPFIFVSGTLGEEQAADSLRNGATDYVLKQRPARLVPAVRRALKEARESAELKRAEEAMRMSEFKYRHLFESLSDAAFLIEEQTGRIIDANHQAERLTGLTRSGLLGKRIESLHAPEKKDDYRRRLAARPNLDELADFESEIRSKDCRSIQVHIGAAPITLYETRLVLAVYRDITERKQIEEQFRQSQKMDAIGQLASGVAHDFNNLLTVIQGYSQMVLATPNLAPAVINDLKEIFVAGERASSLTRQLLMFSRKQVMRKEALDLNEVVDGVSNMLRRLIPENIILDTSYAARLTPVEADPGMIEQVLLNLAVNARDAMPNGGRIVIGTEAATLDEACVQHHAEARVGEFARLSVRDTGCGMNPEILARMFEPFFTTKEAGKGTGLGLATVFGVVKQHQGWIEVESQVGVGTAFSIFLPAAQHPASSAAADPVESKVRGGSETILVVEDEDTVRRLAVAVLDRQGYRVLEAASGEEALQVWEHHAESIDLLLTDMVMPGDFTGRELAERLQAQRPALKVIYSSGYSPEMMNEVFAFDEKIRFLQKPYLPRMISQAVRDALDGTKDEIR